MIYRKLGGGKQPTASEDRKQMVGELTCVLTSCVADDINEVHGYLDEAVEEHEALQLVDREVLEDAIAELRDALSTSANEAALEFVREIQERTPLLRCLNPTCEVVQMSTNEVLYPYPHEKLLDTISPGDTVPQGLCPKCRGPVYQREEHPEDELHPDLKLAEGMPVPKLMEKAIHETLSGDEASRVLEALRNSGDNTGVTGYTASDSTADLDPFYTK